MRYKIDETYKLAFEAFLHFRLLGSQPGMHYMSLNTLVKIYCIYSKLEKKGLTQDVFGTCSTFSTTVKFGRSKVCSSHFRSYLLLKPYFEKYKLSKKIEAEITRREEGPNNNSKGKI
jgi:hypothetical protein